MTQPPPPPPVLPQQDSAPQSQSQQQQQQQQQNQHQLQNQVARGNTAPSQSGQNGPQGPVQWSANKSKKIYQIRGSNFEVDPQYEVIKAIGIGAYGLVCSAQDVTTKQFVAVKKMPKLFDDLIDGRRVLREIRILRWLGRHPNILELVGVSRPREFSSQERNSFREVYFVTELLDADLSQLLRSRQRLSIDHHAFITYQLLGAIAYTHSAGVIHRDLKPSNLLVNANCEVRLADFGLSRANVPPPQAFANTTLSSASNSPQPQQGLPGMSPAPCGGVAGGMQQEQPFGSAAAGSNSLSSAGGGKIMNSNAAAISEMMDWLPEQAEQAANNRLAAMRRHIPENQQQLGNNNNDNSGTNSNSVSPGATPMSFDLTEYVVTRWYRPPELLLGVGYNHSVDLWSVGCILMEIVTRRPLFDGKNYMEQLEKIAELVPMPAPADVPSMLVRCRNQEPAKCIERLRKQHDQSQFANKLANGTQELEDAMQKHGYNNLVRRLMRYLKLPAEHADPSTPMAKAVDLISHLLNFHLMHRMSAADACLHPFLAKHVTSPEKAEDSITYKAEQAEACLKMYKSATGTTGVCAYEAFHNECMTECCPFNMWAFDHKAKISEKELRSEFWVDMTLGQNPTSPNKNNNSTSNATSSASSSSSLSQDQTPK